MAATPAGPACTAWPPARGGSRMPPPPRSRSPPGRDGRRGELMATERELVADLSHRLRTPLTALRLEAERARGFESDGRLALAVQAMEREVDHLIDTARRPTEARAPESEQCDASEVVRN